MPSETSDLVCFSPIDWDSFPEKRPQQLMRRFAHNRRVFFIEPVRCHFQKSHLRLSGRGDGLRIVSPHLTSVRQANAEFLRLLQLMFDDLGIMNATLWCMTSSAIAWMPHLDGAIRVYDDETETIETRSLAFLDGFDLVFVPHPMSQQDDLKRYPKEGLEENSISPHTPIHFVSRSIDESQRTLLSNHDWDRLWSEAAAAERETARAADQFFQQRPLPAFISAKLLQHRPSIL